MRSPAVRIQAPCRDAWRGARPRQAPSNGAGAILGLQRTAGNAAVGRLLLDGHPVVQRKRPPKRPPPTKSPPKRAAGEYGLDITAHQTAYVAKAVSLWKTRKRMTLQDFATTLLQTVDGQLKSFGVPLFNSAIDTGLAANGLFDSEHWILRVNPDLFGGPGAATLGDLSPAEVRDSAGTIYHEARHVDQDVLVVRVLLEQGKTPAQIVAATKIDATAVAAIKAATFTDPLDAAQRAHAGRLYDVMYGAHNELLTFLLANTAAFTGLVELAATGSTITAGTPHVATFATWRTTTLGPKIASLRGVKRRSAAEATLLTDLQAVDRALAALAARSVKLPPGKEPAGAAAKAIRALATTAWKAVFAAQAHLESEKDAYRVEAEITAGLKTAGVR